MNKAHLKKKALLDALKDLESLLVAYSGGVDSTFLLAAAHEVLGERVLAVTATAPFYLSKEIAEAVSFVRAHGIDHLLIRSDAGSLPAFKANSPDRCYHCKKLLFTKLRDLAEQRGIKHIAHAANVDDSDDYRPGAQAAVEAGVLSPLVDAQLSKDEIRYLSRQMGLPTWDKPAMACLSSRIPYGEPITDEKLRMIEAAEAFLAVHGFKQFRVRCHGSLARIEVEKPGLARILEAGLREEIIARFKEIGFLYVSMDLEGYVTGSMNREIRVKT